MCICVYVHLFVCICLYVCMCMYVCVHVCFCVQGGEDGFRALGDIPMD